ncbi:Uncharacterised protein [Neisseria animaloris]|uniref:hypothetical protein n=1 Tax=Neisseria animaloris TaxID=326522 RepID=UPI000A1991D8|nr:hypothetical protein [Neisseria animaloris]OSI07914.1 hypothetical protein BWD08_04700 [Neisseria animaloris]VEH87656.1 Uncharacterised protein [Neisseria animaloris]
MKKIIHLNFRIALIILFIYFVYLTGIWIKDNSTLVVPVITALISLIGIMYVQWQSKSREIQESHRTKKIEVYMLFFDIIEEFQASIKRNQEINIDNKELQDKFQKLTRGLILWASDDVIKAWLNFRNISSPNSDLLTPLQKANDMYMAIRKDLGHKDNNLKNLDLIKMNLSNPEELNQ